MRELLDLLDRDGPPERCEEDEEEADAVVALVVVVRVSEGGVRFLGELGTVGGTKRLFRRPA